MNKLLVPLVLVPAGILILVTVARAWLELHSPDSGFTKVVSINYLSIAWLLVAPAIMLAKGLSLAQGLIAALVFFVLHRIANGTVYALAWANQWKVEGTDELVRYAAQIKAGVGEGEAEPSTMFVFLSNSLFPAGFALVFTAAIWIVTWAIAFRGKRPLVGAASVS